MNTVEKAEKMLGKINNRYNLTCKEMERDISGIQSRYIQPYKLCL